MFLALKEMRKEKTRFILIISITVLISYLVYFLLGLAYGLATDNTSVIPPLQAQQILLAKGSNKNIQASLIDRALLETELQDVQYSLMNLSRSSAYINGKADEANALSLVLIGSNQPSKIMPKLLEGSDQIAENKVVASISLKEEVGLKIGDRIQLSTNGQTFEIIGFSEESKYNTSSVIYTDLLNSSATFMTVPEKAKEIPEKVSAAIIHSGNVDELSREFEVLEVQSFINAIPGYTAQILTFGLMISFLVVIASIVLGVFLFIITMQKKQIFAIMKIQGISNRYITQSVFVQTLLVISIGLLLGLLLTGVTALSLPIKVPFNLNGVWAGMITTAMLLTSLVGAVFSLRIVSRVDPLEVLN